jgi:phenylalanyl-tRNA synthetase beta subunit
MSKTSAACLFSVSLFSVKRYCRIAKQGASLEPRKGGGRPPKTDETVEKRLEEDVEKRPAATISERRRFLERTTGKALSDSNVERLLKRMGFSRENGLLWGAGARRMAIRAAWRVTVVREIATERLEFLRTRLGPHLSSPALRLVTKG